MSALAKEDTARHLQGARQAPAPLLPCGVHSEVGRLRSVMVCRPGMAHLRLTPENRREWAFRDLFWVERAQRDFDRFVTLLTERGIEVLELHDLLAQTMERTRARRWLLERVLMTETLGPSLLEDLMAALGELPPARLSEFLIGGMTAADLPMPARAAAGSLLDLEEFVLPPLPHTLFMRDSSSWIGEGVALNRPWWPARRGESLLITAVYRFHPRFAPATIRFWCGDGSGEACPAAIEGADLMTLGAGVVLIGLNHRTSAHSAVRIARALFDGGAARTVIAAQMPRSEAALPLDAVFTPCSPEVVTYAPQVVDRIVCHELRPSGGAADLLTHRHDGRHMLDVLSEALEVPAFNAIATGADRFDRHPEGWDDGNNVLALEPGVVVGYDRNTRTNRRLREAGIEVLEVPGSELARGRAGVHSMTCPIGREAVAYR